MSTKRTCIVGVGSWQADDCLGWQAIEQLHGRLPPSFLMRAVKSPVDIIDSLADCKRLWIVDACISQDPPGTIYRCQWPSEQLALLRWSTTHDFSVLATLELANQLGLLPAQVVVWVVTVKCMQFGEIASAEVSQWVSRLIEQIVKECQ